MIYTKKPQLISTKTSIMVDYACEHLKIPYKWGGDDPTGFDCSGFIQEVLAAVGYDPKGDQTAHTLYQELLKQGWEECSPEDLIREGSILFFGSKELITHVSISYDAYHMIEAGGGNSKTKTLQDAINQNAFIRIRPISNRKDLVAILYPTN